MKPVADSILEWLKARMDLAQIQYDDAYRTASETTISYYLGRLDEAKATYNAWETQVTK